MVTKLKLLLFLIIAFVSEGLANDFPCPESFDIAPCRCYVDSYDHLILDCSMGESDEQMAGIFNQYWPVKNFYKWRISDNIHLKNFDYDLHGLTFEYIDFDNLSLMKTVSPDFFSESSADLKELHIIGTIMETFPLGNVSEFAILTTISISGSKLEVIPPIVSESLEELAVNYSPLLTDIPAGK